MGQGSSIKSKRGHRNDLNNCTGNFLILTDSKEILDEASITSIKTYGESGISALPLEHIMPKESLYRATNNNRVPNGSSLTCQRKMHRKSERHNESETDTASLRFVQEQKRQEKIKKGCTCRFIITSGVTSEEDSKQKLKQSHSCVFDETSESNTNNNIMYNIPSYETRLHKPKHKQASISKGENSKSRNHTIGKAGQVAYEKNYTYENSNVVMLSSVVPITTQALVQECGSSLHEKHSVGEERKQSSESINGTQEYSRARFTCPSCGVTSSAFLTAKDLKKLSLLKPLKSHTVEDSQSYVDCKACNSTKALKRQILENQNLCREESPEVRVLKNPKAEHANIHPSYTPSHCKSNENIISESILSKQYTPEKLYVALKRREAFSKSERQAAASNKQTPHSAHRKEKDCTLEEFFTKSESSEDDESTDLDEPIDERSQHRKVAANSANPNSRKMCETKSRPNESWSKSSSHHSSRSTQSKLDKLILESVNKSSFKPTKLYSSKSPNNPTNKREVSNEDKSGNPSKLIVEISESVIPKNLMEQLTTQSFKNLTYSQTRLTDESIKSLINVSNKEALVKKTCIKKKFESNQKVRSPSITPPNRKETRTDKQTDNQLTQTMQTHIFKNLKMSQVFLSSTKAHAYKDTFKELHKFPNQQLPSNSRKYEHEHEQPLNGLEKSVYTISVSGGTLHSQMSDLSDASLNTSESNMIESNIGGAPHIDNLNDRRKNAQPNKSKDASTNICRKSSSSTSNISLNKKERLLERQSDQTISKNEGFARHKFHRNESHQQKKPQRSSALKEEYARKVEKYKQAEVSKFYETPKKHKMLERYNDKTLSRDLEIEVEDFRESTQTLEKGDLQEITRTTPERDTSRSSPPPAFEITLGDKNKLINEQCVPNGGDSMSYNSILSFAQLSQILEEPSKEELEVLSGKSSKSFTKRSGKFESNGFDTPYCNFWKFDMLGDSYNNSKAVEELMDKFPKDVMCDERGPPIRLPKHSI